MLKLKLNQALSERLCDTFAAPLKYPGRQLPSLATSQITPNAYEDYIYTIPIYFQNV